MNKFEAANVFISLLKSNAQDFTAKVDHGRDHYFYIITHKIHSVSIRIDAHDNVLQTCPMSESDLKFVSEAHLSFLCDWAQTRIAQDEEQRKIDHDNEKINLLTNFYEQK